MPASKVPVIRRAVGYAVTPAEGGIRVVPAFEGIVTDFVVVIFEVLVVVLLVVVFVTLFVVESLVVVLVLVFKVLD